MSGWTAFKETFLRPDTTPLPFSEPTFDPHEGFEGKRKERGKYIFDVVQVVVRTQCRTMFLKKIIELFNLVSYF